MATLREEVKQARTTGEPVARIKPKPTKPKKARSKQPAPTKAGPWSDWYVSNDYKFFWRARQLPNETWDYQLKSDYHDAARQKETNPISPKSSWPTIATTSTGQATEISVCDDSTPATLPKELDDGDQPRPVDTTLTSLAMVHQAPSPGGHTKSDYNGRKRPVGPVMRLLQEARGHKSKVQTKATKSNARDSMLRLGNMDGPQLQQHSEHEPGLNANFEHEYSSWGPGAVPTSPRKTSVLAKKLHARVRSEKDLRSDPKRKVKTWLKGVELDLAPIPLDEEGFPIYG